jgi:hypothetical protein
MLSDSTMEREEEIQPTGYEQTISYEHEMSKEESVRELIYIPK